MIKIKINWWLWNQMFQYAFIKALSIRNNVNFKLDTTWFKNYFRSFDLEILNIEKKYCSKNEIPFYENIYSKNKYVNFLINKTKLVIRRLNPHHFWETQFNYDKNIINIKKWYIEWYFYTEKYFKKHENQIKKDFNFIKKISKKNIKLLEKIRKTNSISIHIRRWDYIENKKTNQFHWVCSIDYYKKAIKYIEKRIDKPIFFIFSDDIDWCKKNLQINWIFVDWNTWDKSWEDMKLMSECKHNIIANSSFSWWGAWLNSNNKKIVISPKKWVNNKNINTSDIIPNNWIKI